jgi:GDP-L-fucose synthase
MSVLVTGGSGFLGSRLQIQEPNWIYVSSSDYNLVDQSECERMYADIKPTAVIHLASMVGGIGKNAASQSDFFTNNCLINLNVVSHAQKFGIKRLMASLSTCAFPNKLANYPFVESDMFSGPPAATNFSYGYSKRMLQVMIRSARQQHGLNYSTFSPSNIYGIGDNFDLQSCHFVPAMVRKIYEAKDGDTVEFWGTGTPLKQQLYVDDLAKIIPFLLKKHNTDLPLIISPDENLSIKQMIEIFLKNIKKDVRIVFNNKLDGQYRKDGSNLKFKELYGDFKFTKFQDGIEKTYRWYKEQIEKGEK